MSRRAFANNECTPKKEIGSQRNSDYQQANYGSPYIDSTFGTRPTVGNMSQTPTKRPQHAYTSSTKKVIFNQENGDQMIVTDSPCVETRGTICVDERTSYIQERSPNYKIKNSEIYQEKNEFGEFTTTIHKSEYVDSNPDYIYQIPAPVVYKKLGKVSQTTRVTEEEHRHFSTLESTNSKLQQSTFKRLDNGILAINGGIEERLDFGSAQKSSRNGGCHTQEIEELRRSHMETKRKLDELISSNRRLVTDDRRSPSRVVRVESDPHQQQPAETVVRTVERVERRQFSASRDFTKELKEENSNLLKKIVELKKTLKDVMKDTKEIAKDRDTLSKKNKDLKKEVEICNTEIQSYKSSEKNSQKSLEQLETMEEQLKSSKEAYLRLKQKFRESDRLVEKYENVIENLKREFDKKENDFEKKFKFFENLKSEISNKDETIRELEIQVGQFSKAIDDLEAKNLDLKLKHQDSKQEEVEILTEKAELMNKIEELLNQIQRCENDNRDKKREIQDQKCKFEEKISDLKHKISILSDTHEKLQTTHTQFNTHFQETKELLKTEMQLKEQFEKKVVYLEKEFSQQSQKSLQELNATRDSISVAEEKYKKKCEDFDNLQQERNQFKSQYQQTKRDLEKAIRSLEELTLEKETIESEFSKVKDSERNWELKATSSSKSVSGLNTRIQEMEKNIDILTTQNSQLTKELKLEIHQKTLMVQKNEEYSLNNQDLQKIIDQLREEILHKEALVIPIFFLISRQRRVE